MDKSFFFYFFIFSHNQLTFFNEYLDIFVFQGHTETDIYLK